MNLVSAYLKNIKVIFIFAIVFIPVRSFSQNLPPKVESWATNVGSGNSVTVTKPTGVVESDLLLIGLMYEKGSSEAVAPPVGWTLVTRTDASTNTGIVTYYKVATANEPTNYPFTLTQGSKWAIGITRISNVNTSKPIDISLGANGSSSTSVNAPSITTTGNNRLVLCFYTLKKATTFTPASSTIERYDVPNTAGGQPSNMMASFTQENLGATGNKVATALESEFWAGQQVAITPADPLPLPVELVHFTAKTMNNHAVVLNWTTATELDNSFFAIERSTSLGNFKEIGQITGAGSSNIKHTYSFIDHSPLTGTSYYRLRQVDYDGAFEYSPIRAVALAGNSTMELTLSPNPASGSSVLLQLQGLSSDEETNVEVTDIRGKRISYQHLTKPNIALRTECLKPGTYLVRVLGRSGTLTQRLVIQ